MDRDYVSNLPTGGLDSTTEAEWKRFREGRSENPWGHFVWSRCLRGIQLAEQTSDRWWSKAYTCIYVASWGLTYTVEVRRWSKSPFSRQHFFEKKRQNHPAMSSAVECSWPWSPRMMEILALRPSPPAFLTVDHHFLLGRDPLWRSQCRRADSRAFAWRMHAAQFEEESLYRSSFCRFATKLNSPSQRGAKSRDGFSNRVLPEDSFSRDKENPSYLQVHIPFEEGWSLLPVLEVPCLFIGVCLLVGVDMRSAINHNTTS